MNSCHFISVCCRSEKLNYTLFELPDFPNNPTQYERVYGKCNMK